MEFLSKEEYQRTVYEDGFSFKNRIKLFKDGFRHLLNNSFSLFVSHIMWMVFFIGVFALDVFITHQWFFYQGKTFLQTQDWMDYLMTWQLIFMVAILYNSQQLFVINNIAKTEGFLSEKNRYCFLGVFNLFIRQLPLLIKTSFIFSIFLYMSLYACGYLLQKFNFEGFYAILIAIVCFLCLVLVYFTMLAMPLIYLSEHLYPMKWNIFKRTKIALEKIAKMFSLIIPTLVGHVFVLLFIIGLIIYVIQNSLPVSLVVEEKGDYTALAITVIGFLSIVQTFLNKARLRSLALMFSMTENQDEYEERLTLPIKNTKAKETE